MLLVYKRRVLIRFPCLYNLNKLSVINVIVLPEAFVTRGATIVACFFMNGIFPDILVNNPVEELNPTLAFCAVVPKLPS